MGRDRSWVVRITTAECAVELRCSAGGFCSVALLWDVRIVRILDCRPCRLCDLCARRDPA